MFVFDWALEIPAMELRASIPAHGGRLISWDWYNGGFPFDYPQFHRRD